MGELEVDDEDRPVNPPMLKGTEVLWNPFSDIVPRVTAEQRRAAQQEAAARRAAAEKGAEGSMSDDGTVCVLFVWCCQIECCCVWLGVGVNLFTGVCACLLGCVCFLLVCLHMYACMYLCVLCRYCVCVAPHAPTAAARPKKKNATLLSFGEEAEEEETVFKAAPKLKSAHDATNDSRLAKQHADDLKVRCHASLCCCWARSFVLLC